MADKKISQLPSVSSVTNSDVFPVVATNATSQITLSNLAASMPNVPSASYADYANVAGTANSVSLVAGPGIIVNGLSITSSLRTVNGTFPTNGNVTISLTGVLTGTSASLIVSSSGTVTGSITNGTIWVVSQDPTPANNGDVYVFVSGSTGVWYSVAPLDTAAADARYIKLDGANSPLTGNLNIGGYNLTNIGSAVGGQFSGSFSGSFRGNGSGLTGLSTFPYTGSAQITGSLTLTGSLNIGNIGGNTSSLVNIALPSSSYSPNTTQALSFGSFIDDLNRMPDTAASAIPIIPAGYQSYYIYANKSYNGRTDVRLYSMTTNGFTSKSPIYSSTITIISKAGGNNPMFVNCGLTDIVSAFVIGGTTQPSHSIAPNSYATYLFDKVSTNWVVIATGSLP